MAEQEPDYSKEFSKDSFWKILMCINTDGEITVAKACELIRDMLAGRSYLVPNYVVDEAKDH